ncbi:uroporphyrinogen-III C-methyltransferase [Marinobacter sp. C2H3]|uniref:uroporphyrinogen-III C-methyltransferase n=1 Tax=Marinobacter sp. C2H3 TaxID=3119003 RepID=UPI00300F27FF
MTNTTDQLPAPIQQPPARPRRTWPLWLLATLALILAIALAVWNWQQWREHQATVQRLQQLQQDTRQFEDQFGDLGSQRASRLQALEDKLAAQRELIATQQRQIDHNAQTLLDAGNRTRTDWLLAEAEYLLRIANQRLQVEKDIRGAAKALAAADDVLKESDDVGVYPVREAVAKERMALRSIENVDRTGLYLALEAAIDQVQQITDQALIREAAPGFVAGTDGGGESARDAVEGGPSVFTRAWNAVTDTLSRIVVVRRLDEPVKPLLSPDQSAYARLNLQLMLEEAEMAVLRGNQTLYVQALEKARRTIDDWYNPEYPGVQALAGSLTELAGRNVDPALPDISRSLDLLKRRLDGRGSQSGGASDTSGGASGPKTPAANTTDAKGTAS